MWPVRPKYPLSGETYRKWIYYVGGLCAIQILLGRVCDPLLGGGAYKPGGLIAKGEVICQFIRYMKLDIQGVDSN
jgi:hypothetical protein